MVLVFETQVSSISHPRPRWSWLRGAFFIKFHNPANHPPGFVKVHSHLIVKAVEHDCGPRIGIPDHRPPRRQPLIFRFLSHQTGIRPFGYLAGLAVTKLAGPKRVMFHLEMRAKVLAGGFFMEPGK